MLLDFVTDLLIVLAIRLAVAVEPVVPPVHRLSDCCCLIRCWDHLAVKHWPGDECYSKQREVKKEKKENKKKIKRKIEFD